MKAAIEHRKKTEEAMQKVMHAWTTSPRHVQAMAGHVMEPILEAMKSLSAQVEHMLDELEKFKGN